MDQDAGTRARAHRAGLLTVLLLFGLPLFVALDTREAANDEAIYSYAVQRTLETGEWLTPRAIPTDSAFLEKPPLKFWMVAAPMAAGLVSRGETGMRLLDATFGLLAFAYLYLLGARLARPACGILAGLLLFTFQPIVIYAFRMNHMDGTLVLGLLRRHLPLRPLDGVDRSMRAPPRGARRRALLHPGVR